MTMRSAIGILAIIVALIGSAFLRVWPQRSIFGAAYINSLEHFGGCWSGDVRFCDYDPFDDDR